jgi:hypothetical protein
MPGEQQEQKKNRRAKGIYGPAYDNLFRLQEEIGQENLDRQLRTLSQVDAAPDKGPVRPSALDPGIQHLLEHRFFLHREWNARRLGLVAAAGAACATLLILPVSYWAIIRPQQSEGEHLASALERVRQEKLQLTAAKQKAERVAQTFAANYSGHQRQLDAQQQMIRHLKASQNKERTLYTVASSGLQQQTQLKNCLLDRLMLYKEREAAPYVGHVIGVTAGATTSDVEVLHDWKPQKPQAKLLRSNKVEFAWAPIPDAISYTVIVQRSDNGTPISLPAGKNTHRVATLPDHGPPDKIHYYTWSLEIKLAGKTQLCVTPRVVIAVFDTERYQRFLLSESVRTIKAP